MDEIRGFRSRNICELEEAIIEQNKKYDQMEDQINDQITHIRAQEEPRNE